MLGDIDIRNVGMEDDILGSQARGWCIDCGKALQSNEKGLEQCWDCIVD
jgi:hypothetical protein